MAWFSLTPKLPPSSQRQPDVHTVPQFPGEPAHALFGATCWCHPVATQVAGSFGARTVVHRSLTCPAENDMTGPIPLS